MGRKPKVTPTDLPSAPLVADADDPTASGLKTIEGKPLPPRYINGRPNPLHWKAKVAAVSDLAHRVTMLEADLPRGLNLSQVLDVLSFEAKHYGMDPKHVLDTRSDGEKMSDAVEKLLAGNPIDEFADSELDLLEQETENAVSGCENLINERKVSLEEDKAKEMAEFVQYAQEQMDTARKRAESGKIWLNRIRRVKRLRDCLRTPTVPKGEHLRRTQAYQAAKVLIYMLIVTRSSMKMGLRDGKYADHKIHLIGPPHCRFATDTWEAENGIDYPTKGPDKGKAIPGVVPYEGIILMAHPGLGKTSFVMAHAGLSASTDPQMQAAYLHSKEEKAKEKLAFIKEMFDTNNPMGRRREVLFPGLRKTDDKNNASSMNLAGKDPKPSPTLIAAGVRNAGLGGDTNKQYWDDVVPQSDRDQPTERDRRFHTLAFTWKSRNRGKGFIILSGYPFHNDDALWRHVRMAREKKIVWLVSRLPAGGPSTTPQFKPIWQEVYPAHRLRTLFEESGRNHSLWSANYMLNPISDEGRRIKCVSFYDPSAQEHIDFMKSAQMHLTIDPTATSRETSDKAGILYGGLGEVRIDRDGVDFYENRFRVVDAARLHLNQIDLSEHVASFVLQRPTYLVHMECRSSSGSATADLIRRDYGMEVQRHDPTSKSKDIRLKDCAGVIDNSSREFPAKVEFPGVWENGKLVCDPRFQWIIKQLLDFGVETEDDIVDALTQIVNWFLRTGDLIAGNTGATQMVQRAMEATGDPRVLAMLREYETNRDVRTADEQDAHFIMRREEAP